MGRVAVVTGAASGMGLAIGQRLARTGYRVALLDRDGEAAQREAEKLRAEGHSAIEQRSCSVTPPMPMSATRTGAIAPTS